MRKTLVRAFVLLVGSVPFLMACGGGKKYDPPPATVTPGSVNTSNGGGSTATSGSSLSSMASSAVSLTSPQFATAGGPAFAGNNNQTDVSFPASSRSLQSGSGVHPSDDTTVTVMRNTQNFSVVRVVIPSIGMDETFTANTDLRGFQGDTPFYGMNYVVLGEWGHWSSGRTASYTESVFGYETPVSAVPKTGTAQFSGWASATVFKGSASGAYVDGRADVSVDFASGKLTGALTNMQVRSLGSAQPWNDVSVNASIVGGTNKFTGATAVTSTPNSALSLTGSATGLIDGGFYGPGADELGAVWSLTDATGSAVGGLVGRR